MRFEDIANEEPLLLKHLNIDHVIHRQWKNSNRMSGYTEDQLTKLYFEQLSKEEIDRLYDLYRYDFLLFSYNFKYGQGGAEEKLLL